MRWGFARNMVFVLALAVEVTAQTRPDFSGTWLLNAALSVGLRDDERKGVTLVVRQSAREIVFERTLVGGEPRVIRYALDGSESTSRAGNTEITARSRWDGDKLLSEGTQRASVLLIRITAKFKEVRHLSDNGQTMVAESTFWRGNERTDRKLVFNRGREGR
ncbi:MAG: hypothetical protein Q7R30_03925 [Acidobacteriota bacterium]|nr:hypothetical protein [Acidobacteriota bacterium]